MHAPTQDALFDLRARRMVARAYEAPGALSRRFRARRFARVLALIDEIIAEKGRCRIADLGGSAYYWRIAGDELARRPLEITLINPAEGGGEGAPFIHLPADATDLATLEDQSFDLAHSNSAIEHVGDWAKMRAFAANMRRLAPRYYLQVPYFWFPVEPHFRAPFFHWLPEQVRCRLVMRFALGFRGRKSDVASAMEAVQSARLLDRAQLRALCPDAEIVSERAFGLTKSLIAIRG